MVGYGGGGVFGGGDWGAFFEFEIGGGGRFEERGGGEVVLGVVGVFPDHEGLGC